MTSVQFAPAVAVLGQNLTKMLLLFEDELSEEAMTAKKEVGKREQIRKRWKKFQETLGFTDKEMTVYRSFPQNVKALESSPELAKNDVIIEVTEAKNCMAGYKPGDTFQVDPFGFLIVDKCPPKLCTAAIFAFKPLIACAWQALFNGGTEILHNTVRCPDVGVHRAGAGEVTLRVHVAPKGEKLKSQKPEKAVRKHSHKDR